MDFTVEELFTRDDPLAEITDKYAAALLFTEAGIAPAWLEPATQLVVVGEPYILWITAPHVVAALMRGLANNPDIAAGQLRQPQAVDYLLRRSSLAGEEMAAEIGELLIAAATQGTPTAAEVAGATIAAIGSDDVHPHDAVLPYAAIVGGIYIDELAYSLADSVADPTYSPRFDVPRTSARIFIREVMRNAEGSANLLAATELWVRSIIAPAGVATFDDYTSWVQNKTDDIGRLLGTIVSADRAISVEKAEERARRRAMLLDVVKALGQVGARFTGPAGVALQPSVEMLRDRAEELLGSNHVGAAYHANQLLHEEILDQLDEALHQVINAMDLTSANGKLDPGETELEEGAVRNLLRGLIAAELLAYSAIDLRPGPG